MISRVRPRRQEGAEGRPSPTVRVPRRSRRPAAGLVADPRLRRGHDAATSTSAGTLRDAGSTFATGTGAPDGIDSWLAVSTSAGSALSRHDVATCLEHY
jgi:hypothetical protein